MNQQRRVEYARGNMCVSHAAHVTDALCLISRKRRIFEWQEKTAFGRFSWMGLN
jgi:hypothetical protein